ncbi:cation:proton antiporter [Gynuella sunshinyii]|uniref:Kef-type K+ transport system, predicted NAD-binding component n=1 Tax=Gynuella sunshinyii YC6258 TaxID=1445510 RepID=A0A0C5VM03_9GAMM|nr:cation:proton antiporter [Gynuella sunshinyii]AJQ95331.1 kef-type K+ transport system, predicted NAD-binding component [Gynuella sunshinyii YC6258]
MHEGTLVFSFFLIFTGAALFATIALFTRQPLLIAYIVLGAVIGPFGTGWIETSESISQISQIGIIFLLFLIGLDMQPVNLLHTLRKAVIVALASSIIFAACGFAATYAFGFSTTESLIVGLAMMFSSTIIGIKLLPTTVLHHRHTGELMVGLLLLQDMIAIIVLLGLGGVSKGNQDVFDYLVTLISLPLLIAGAWLIVRFIFLPLLQKFDRFQEYIFLLSIGWCLGLASASEAVGLSSEIGAFVAGVSIASSPISLYIASSLKPLRDFFLILFFFSIGASFDFSLLSDVMIPAMTLALLYLGLKPVAFRLLLGKQSENSKLAWDVGFRLGQNSEFSILIAYIATSSLLIGEKASLLIQATAIITFALSSYIVIFNFPNPIAVKESLRRD